MAKDESNKLPQPIVIVPTNEVIGSTFSQLFNVSVDNANITIEFVYAHPQDPINKSQIVSRVTLPRPSGEELAKLILSTVKIHVERTREKKEDGTN